MKSVNEARLPLARGRRRGVFGFGAGAAFRWLALFVLLGVNLPALFAGALALFSSGGDHELHFGFAESHVEITLHHRDAGIAKAKRTKHIHSSLECMIFGEANPGNESDHHLGFSRQHVVSEKDDLKMPRLAGAVASLSTGPARAAVSAVSGRGQSVRCIAGKSGRRLASAGASARRYDAHLKTPPPCPKGPGGWIGLDRGSRHQRTCGLLFGTIRITGGVPLTALTIRGFRSPGKQPIYYETNFRSRSLRHDVDKCLCRGHAESG